MPLSRYRRPAFPFALSGPWRIFRIGLQDFRFAFHSTRIVAYAHMQFFPEGKWPGCPSEFRTLRNLANHESYALPLGHTGSAKGKGCQDFRAELLRTLFFYAPLNRIIRSTFAQHWLVSHHSRFNTMAEVFKSPHYFLHIFYIPRFSNIEVRHPL